MILNQLKRSVAEWKMAYSLFTTQKPSQTTHVVGEDLYPSSHNHGSDKWFPPILRFLSFGVVFHFHDWNGYADFNL